MEVVDIIKLKNLVPDLIRSCYPNDSVEDINNIPSYKVELPEEIFKNLSNELVKQLMLEYPNVVGNVVEKSKYNSDSKPGVRITKNLFPYTGWVELRPSNEEYFKIEKITKNI